MDISLQKAITTTQILLNGSSWGAADLFAFLKMKKRVLFQNHPPDWLILRLPFENVSQGKDNDDQFLYF